MSRVISRTAALTCPACDRGFTGCWRSGKTAPQQCPACGHTFIATWPGFTFRPQTVIVPPALDDGDRDDTR